MRSKRRVWIQAAIDLYDLELAKQVAGMAVKAGVDWVEAGTPLVYGQGLRGVDEMVKVAAGRPVVVDYKAADGCYDSFRHAAEHGAKYAVVMAYADNGSIREAIQAAEDTGIQVVADLMYVKDGPKRARELELLGVDALFVHLGFDEASHNPLRRQYDGVAEVMDAVESIPVGVACDLKDAALEAIERGVSWVTFGLPILASPQNFDACKEYIDAVHNARG